MLNRYRDVFASFANHNVKYVVIGGIAAVIHGVPRATFDLDILIEATETNVRNLLSALEEAGLATAALIAVSSVLEHEITVFEDYVRIDVQTRTPGIDFQGAWERRDTFTHGEVEIHLTCLSDLIASKRAAGRRIDLEDVALLEQDAGEPGGP